MSIESVPFSWVTDFFKAVIAGLLALTVWLLRKFGEQHLETIKELTAEVRVMHQSIQSVSDRVTKIEAWRESQHMNHEGRNHDE